MKKFIWLFALVLFVGACGDDDDPSGPPGGGTNPPPVQGNFIHGVFRIDAPCTLVMSSAAAKVSRNGQTHNASATGYVVGDHTSWTQNSNFKYSRNSDGSTSANLSAVPVGTHRLNEMDDGGAWFQWSGLVIASASGADIAKFFPTDGIGAMAMAITKKADGTCVAGKP